MKKYLLFSILALIVVQAPCGAFAETSEIELKTDATTTPPDVTAAKDEDTPVVLEEIAGDRDLTGTRPWRVPDFSKQAGALGWTNNVFAVPKGLEINYQFWLDIYTRYTTDQGLLHDAEYIDLIYNVLDFTHITSRTDLTEGQKSRMRTKAVKDAKKEIVVMLKKLQGTKDPAGLTPEERKVWDYFLKIEGKNKFVEASKKNRLRFQLGQRDRMVQGIFFSGRYLEDFEQAFREQGLPMELTRIPFVESSFNVLARSKVGASGLWQIMRYTCKPFMRLNSAVDRRNYPLDAARLAAKLFRMNYNMLESWPLAITGYNHGPAGVQKLTRLAKSREIGDLVHNTGARKHLGFASRNFYASFLAALEAESNAPKYFGPVYWSKPLNGVEINIGKQIKWTQVVTWFDGKAKMAEIFNPHISSLARKPQNSIPRGTVLLIPNAKKDEVQNDLQQPEPVKIARNKKGGARAALEKADEDPQTQIYEVISGDSIYAIAKRYNTSVKKLLELNEIAVPSALKIGQKIKVP